MLIRKKEMTLSTYINFTTIMKKIRNFCLAAGTLLACLSCSDTDNYKYTYTTGKVPNRISIKLTQQEHEQVQVNNKFAFELTDEVFRQNQDDNFLISPMSATFVLAMLENGSANETQQQILNALHYDNETGMNTVCQKLIEGAPQIDTSTEISIANAIFVSDTIPVKDEYVKSMEKTFGAEVSTLNFKEEKAALEQMNSWVSDKTKGKISNIMSELPPANVMMTLNAIYFKGIWEKEFDSKKTSLQTFTHENGQQEMVDMMQIKDNFLCGSFPDFDMIHLVYGNDGYSMEVLLPKEGMSVADVIESLKSINWEYTLNTMMPYEVDVQLPKFSIDYSIDMQAVIKALGMENMFDIEVAEFPRISDAETYVNLFRQKCAIDVNEKGAEATTITASSSNGDISSLPTKIGVAEFHANRPFVYMITENTTGAIYFMGVYK